MIESNKESEPWYMAGDDWTLICDRSKSAVSRETVFSQANGHMGIRAYSEEPGDGEEIREGYMAGLFSHLGPEATQLTGPREFPVSEMVSLPEWFTCTVELDGETFDPGKGICRNEVFELDMRNGVLKRTLEWESPNGKSTQLGFERFLSASVYELMMHRVSIAPLNWSGDACVQWSMDLLVPTKVRFGAKSFPQHPQDHFRLSNLNTCGSFLEAELITRGTEHTLAFAGEVQGGEADSSNPSDGLVLQKVKTSVQQDVVSVCTRTMAVATSRDPGEGKAPLDTVRKIVETSAGKGFDACLDESEEVWASRWKRADIVVDGPARDQKVIRYNLFQLLQMAPWHSDRMSLAARALAFNRYRGTYFWDTETFILPFYSAVFPEVARNLLAFRYHTLEGARETAAHYGAKGALFPWMTEADRGEDHSLFRLTNHLWHQNADIAYAVDQYARFSNDVDFMATMGLEILTETARFWQSQIVFDEDGSAHTEKLVGPDETGAPGRDNGYSNLMIRRNLRVAAHWAEVIAREHPKVFSALQEKLTLTDQEVDAWTHSADHLTIPLIPDLNIPLQDENFLSKPEAPPEVMAFRDNPSAGEVPTAREEYQVIKQADVVLAALLLQDEFTQEEIEAMYDFYEPKTLHISSLSRNTHAVVAALLGRPRDAYRWFLDSAAMDLEDFDGCTADGLHAAAIGGCWQGVVFGFGGLIAEEDGFHTRPHLPEMWDQIHFSIMDRGSPRNIQLNRS